MRNKNYRKPTFPATQRSDEPEQTDAFESLYLAVPGRKMDWTMPGIILSLISVVAAMLASLGYGVSFAVESTFGIPHSTLFASTLDLIDLSSVAMSSLISGGAEHLFNWAALWRIASSLPISILAFPFILWLMAVLLLRYWPRWTPGPISSRGKNWFGTPSREDSWIQVLKSLVWVPAMTAMFTIVAWLISVLPVFLGILVAILPMFGFQLGTAYIEKWVVGADVCTPLATAASRSEARPPSDSVRSSPPKNTRRRVDCVAVTKDGKLLVEGRVVTSTSSAIVVFDPDTGRVRREAMAGVSIDVIELPVAKTPN